MQKRVYCLGLYIHECPKMHYKAQFLPAFLLCHETRKFVDVKLAKPFLEEHALRLNPNAEKADPSMLEDTEESLLVLIYEDRVLMTYKQAVEKYGEKVSNKLKDFLPLLSPPPPSSAFIITLS